MKRGFLLLGALSVLLVIAGQANANIISVSGPNSALGSPPAIITAPPDVRDDAAYNTGMEGFNERQRVILPANISIDGGGIIPAGTLVDSHMIFLNTGPGNNTQANSHFNVQWTFDGAILGVMSDTNGSLEVASSPILGAPGTIYPAAPFSARGLEGNSGPGPSNDGYAISGNTLSIGVGMYVTEPGDWIRVVTQPIPAPGAFLLGGIGVGLVGWLRNRRTL
ncbi:MAG: hypothetical protein JSU94_00140 [Phycisphaerales bacterium]|nr:MAG: hypothetical protein JSU94_00140 [Phycisphaerales bacterium]